MKRIGIMLSLSMLVIVLQTATCFAGTLRITESSPHDGYTGAHPENAAVKLYFNQDVTSKENDKINEAFFKFTDPKGKTVPITVIHDPREKDMILVVVNNTLKENTQYKLSVSGDFIAASGDVLGDDKTISFKTRDTSNDMMINMILMGVMFVGILFFSTRQMKKQAQKDAAENAKENKVNPYKVSKETGKSVVEIVEKTEKQKQKKAAAEAKKKSAASSQSTGREENQEANDNKRVKGPRPISAGGSTYITGRKERAAKEAERKAAARAAGTTRPKNQGGKSKNKNKKK